MNYDEDDDAHARVVFHIGKEPGDVRVRYVRDNARRGVRYLEFRDNMEARMGTSINSLL